MKKNIKCNKLSKILLGLSLLTFTSCSNLFFDMLNEDGTVKTGDTSLQSSSDSTDKITSSESKVQPGKTTVNPVRNPGPVIIPNAHPEEFFSPEEDKELKNADVNSGIVVIKSTSPKYNQIIFNPDVHTYEIGYPEEQQEKYGKYASSVYLRAEDDPVTIKAFKNDVNAKITYTAIQTRTTNIENGSLKTTHIAEGTELFVDLPTGSQPAVAFSVAGGPGDPIVFSTLPYGTTLVTITITADDDNYSDSYNVYLNKKHVLTSLMLSESSNSAKNDLTTALVVLKESDGFNNNQISYEPSKTEYTIEPLTSKDNLAYLKAVPSDKNAKVTWTAVYTAQPVYKYDYYQTVTTTTVKVNSNGKLVEGPLTSRVTTKVNSAVENHSEITEQTDANGITTTTTTSTTIRKTIVGLDHMEPVPEEDISSILLPVENQNTDRVRIATLPYGETKVTATVHGDGSQNSINQVYTINIPRVKFSATEEGSDPLGTSNDESPAVNDETSKLIDLSVTNLETLDDKGNPVNVETQATENFTYNRDETIYSVVVDEDTDVMKINPGLMENEVMSNPVSKTKYSQLESNNYSVNLVGGLQVITFTVTEEGCEPRIYTIYAYKQSGNTILESIDYSSYDSVSGRWTSLSMAEANYSAGVTAMSPSAARLTNGAASSAAANTYSLTARADNAVDVTQMEFSVKPYDMHTHIYYFVGNTCPEENSAEWGRGYQRNDLNNRILISALSNEGVTAKTTLWMKTVSRPYYHSADLNMILRSDITYHKIEISKAGNQNVALKELFVDTVNENQVEKNLYSDLDTENAAGIIHTASSIIKNVTTDIDIAKIYFRLADDDAKDNKTVTYSIVNNRASSTAQTSNTSFTMLPSPGSLAGSTSIISGKKYYVITLGEVEYETAGSVAAGRTSSDLPMGETIVKIAVNGKQAATVTLKKPDLDTYTLTAKPAIGGGAYGVYTTSFYDTVYYLNHGVEEVDLTMYTSQKNEKIFRQSYKKIAEQNGTAASEVYGITDEDDNITLTQSSDKPYTKWTSTVKNIPVGTSQVEYKVESAVGGQYFTTCTVTFVRAEDTETRLQSYNVKGPNKAITNFNWSDTGSLFEGNIYVNNYKLGDGTGEYTITALPMNSNETLSVYVYGSNTKDINLNELSSLSSKTVQPGLKGTYTFDAVAGDKFILVHVVVTNKTNTSYVRYYDTLITIDPEVTTKITATGKQYYNSDETDYDAMNFYKADKTITSASTNINSNGLIRINVSKSAKASWNDGYPKVTVDSVDGQDITSQLTIDENKNITIPYSVYSNYPGKTLNVIYKGTAESGAEEEFVYPIEISKLESVTSYGTRTSSTNSYSYVLPSTTNKKQIAYRFGSQINDSATNWIYTKTTTPAESGSNTGGVDIVGSLNNGSTWGATSYNFSGLHYLVKAGSNIYLAKLEADPSDKNKATVNTFYLLDAGTQTVEEKSAADLGINLSVNAGVSYAGTTPYLLLQATVSGADQLGAIMDTLVAPESDATDSSADSVGITETNNGFKMTGSGYKFNVFLKNAFGVDDVSRFWYGAYTDTSGALNYLTTVFENETPALASGADSAISFSWDLESTSETSKTIRFTIE